MTAEAVSSSPASKHVPARALVISVMLTMLIAIGVFVAFFTMYVQPLLTFQDARLVAQQKAIVSLTQRVSALEESGVAAPKAAAAPAPAAPAAAAPAPAGK